jgi:hypothetical protein
MSELRAGFVAVHSSVKGRRRRPGHGVVIFSRTIVALWRFSTCRIACSAPASGGSTMTPHLIKGMEQFVIVIHVKTACTPTVIGEHSNLC